MTVSKSSSIVGQMLEASGPALIAVLPFHNSQDDVHAVVNGELYNYEEHKAQLANEYDFQGDSDCEVVLALYKHYGLSFLQHLRGEFALVLYDAKRNVLIAARDRYGIKSLYYTVQDGRLLISTEMKSFLPYGWKPEWNVQSLRENGWRFDSRTFFKDVYKILPGHYLVCKQFRDLQQKVYWDIEYPDKREVDTRSEEEIILGLRERLLDAVRLRLHADVPVGVYLSGGLDSSGLAGMAAHLIKTEGAKFGNDASGDTKRLKCFSVQFDKDSGADESDIAQRTAEWLGVDFIPVHMDEAAIAANFEATAWNSEAANPDANGTGRLALSKHVHNHGIKVVLTGTSQVINPAFKHLLTSTLGEGADENFAGYSLFAADSLKEADPSWPASTLSEPEREAAFRDALKKSDIFRFGDVPKSSQSTKRMLANTNISPTLCTHTPLPFAPWTDKFAVNDQETTIAESFNGRVLNDMQNKWHPLHTSEYIWSKTIFTNLILRYLGDNVDMVDHVESRIAYLDNRVSEYANSIPPSLKMRYDPATKTLREKHILREALKPFITEEIYSRRKHPYMGPIRYTANGPFHQVIKSLVTKENVEQLGFIDWSRVEGLAEKAFVQHEHLAYLTVLSVAQFVVFSQRFGVKRADPL
ncbi:hypothetical protein SLS60_009648 [Paraconiothyrium brasiliense]|uniref:Glutamine amidotransferase type-2 domain-containing protein n=1 Tax=Paraconiothyrium brasiliense TaxID=300254 RepID=A0ABR3QUW8_9PLEO